MYYKQNFKYTINNDNLNHRNKYFTFEIHDMLYFKYRKAKI